MEFECTLTHDEAGGWTATHLGKDIGDVRVHAITREEALAKLRNEIRYRLELCPCTGESYQHVPIHVVESKS